MIKKSSTMDLRLSSNERLFLNGRSIFKPKKLINLKPNGFKIYTFHAGFKKKLQDLLVLVFDKKAKSSIVYSKTSTPSAPILWDKKNHKGVIKILIVNSGNANAHTGKQGIENIDQYVDYLTNFFKCKKSEVIVSSTGVIGQNFHPKLIINQVAKIKNKSVGNLLDAAKAIMTTDTYPKLAAKNIKIQNSKIRIYGIAKGSGMIHPNMGTMLAYIFIEADISKKILNKLMKHNLENSFNSISTDSDTSTSDTLALFSLNQKKINFSTNKNFNILNKSIAELMSNLALQIVKDGEGLTKLIQIDMHECKSKKQASNVGFSIINSPLVKTAISGEDANWGRIIAAIGKSYEKINQGKIRIYFGKNLICKNGSVYNKINQTKLDKYMKSKTIKISVYLGNGNIQHTLYGNDLSHEYIRINAEYRS